MPTAVRMLQAFFVALLLGGCASTTKVDSIDLTGVEGGMVLVYTNDVQVRTAMEEQLVADLRDRGVSAYASHHDLPDLAGKTPAEVITAARAHKSATVLVVDPVEPGVEASAVVKDPARVTPEHPDLEAFFAYVRAQPAPSGMIDPAREVMVEANLFLLQEAGTRLFWSGVAMTRAADGSGAGIRGLSGEIADALALARQELRAQ